MVVRLAEWTSDHLAKSYELGGEVKIKSGEEYNVTEEMDIRVIAQPLPNKLHHYRGKCNYKQ
jgi:hypothetical protein